MGKNSPFTILLSALLVFSLSTTGFCRGHGGVYRSGSIRGHSAHRSSARHFSPKYTTRKSYGVKRDKRGHIKRSSKARSSFKRHHPCPSTGKAYGSCPGYVIDHIRPLKRGGADHPSNMQWQTVRDAKIKDRIE